MANDSSTILTLQDFRFAYGRDEVVKGVSLEVAHREFVTTIHHHLGIPAAQLATRLKATLEPPVL